MSLEAVFAVLKDGGALGLAAVLFVVAGYLYRRAEKLLEALEELRKEHAAEISRLNDKRLEDIKAVLGALGTFDAGRAAIIDAVERLSEALGAHSSTLSELRDKIIELWHRGKGRAS